MPESETPHEERYETVGEILDVIEELDAVVGIFDTEFDAVDWRSTDVDVSFRVDHAEGSDDA